MENLLDLEAQLNEALNHCGKTKMPQPKACDRSNIPEGFWMDSSCRLRPVTRFFGHINLGAIASNVPRVQVDPGSGLAADRIHGAPPKPPKTPPGGDSQLGRLTYRVQLEEWKCQTARVRANESYYRCRARDDGSEAFCRPLYRQIECPALRAAEQALDAYMKAKRLKTGPVSGGGGGGGF
jgi:hypothetical protein